MDVAAEIRKIDKMENDAMIEINRKKIHDEIMESLKENGFARGERERIVTALMSNRIRHVVVKCMI